MPAVNLRKRVSPTGQWARSQQVNGFYVHSSPPKALQMNPSIIRQWLRSGEVEQLEQVVLEGQGHKLIGEYAPDPKVRAFLKEVPQYIARIGDLNDAVNKGSLKQLQQLVPGDDEEFMKNVMLCKDHTGVGLLHKAVYNDQPEIAKWLLKKYPKTANLKDRDGKTALHYVGVCQDAEGMWNLLVQAGADPNIMDARGRTPAYYMERVGEIELPEPKLPSPEMKRFTSGKHGLVVKPSNIRIWIHDRDLGRLQQVLWEGHGAKLRVETSNNPKVKKFLDGVPYIMNVIKDTHAAVIQDDHSAFIKKTQDPVPSEILTSKDINGLTPLHKAAGLGYLDIVKDIVKRLPKTVFIPDNEGRTALHYAASARDDESVYRWLVNHGADEMVFDQSGKLPHYYKTNPREIPQKNLEVIPEAPRMSLNFPPTFDWGILHIPSANDAEHRIFNGVSNKGEEEHPKSNNVDIWRNNDKNFEEESIPPLIPALGLVENYAEEKRKEEEKKLKEEEDLRIQKVLEAEEAARIVKEVENTRIKEEERIRKAEEEDRRQQELEEKEALREYERMKEASRLEEERLKLLDEEERERVLAEERQRLMDEGLLKQNDDFNEEDEHYDDNEVKDLIRNANMEGLANLVLEGEGNRLLGKRSTNSEIQGFLDNVPTYMSKIEAVHKAAREGELRTMQSALDRRRFAVSKDTPLKVTPLHIATLFGKTPIIKYIGGRFPESLRATDKDGRTALHYAASIPDNGHYFNLLTNLGADRKIKDKFGKSPEYYLNNPGEITQEHLLKEISAPSQIAREMLSDKVPDDKASSRRQLEDKDVLAMMDRCMEIIEEGRSKGSRLPLVQHLTREKYNLIKKRVTKHDHVLLDVIWPGVRILQEENEEDNDYEESGGIIAPDFETYVVFEDLMKPMIQDIHGLGEKLEIHPKSTFFKKDHAKEQAIIAKNLDPQNENGGIIAPDAESYEVYKEVMEPIVKDIHGIQTDSELSNHPDTNFDGKNKPYKTTRTQILREELRLKREEEEKVKQQEKEEKPKINKKTKKVNILVIEEEDKSDEDEANLEREDKHNHEEVDSSVEKPLLILEAMDVDPSGKYVLSSKVECCRNLEQYQLPKTLREDELEIVEKKLESALKYQSIVGSSFINLNEGKIDGFGGSNDSGERYYSLNDFLKGPSAIRTKLAANDLLIPLVENSGTLHSKMIHGNHWPHYRGVYLFSQGHLAAWVNVQEHLRLVSCSKIDSPGNIGEAYGRLASLITALDKHLPPKEDKTLGFLTSRPCCIGNTIKLQATLRLPRLPIETLEDFCEIRNISLKNEDIGDKIYTIKNKQCLGITEYETYENFASAITTLVNAEKALTEEKSKQVSNLLKNMFNKTFTKAVAQ